MRGLLPLLLLLAVVAAPVHAQLTAKVSANTVGVGEVFELSIEAEGNDVSSLTLPDSPDFVFVNSRNPRAASSFSTSIVNGVVSMRRSQSWIYSVHIDKEGTFVLPAVHVKIDGKDYATEPLKVTVTKDAPRRPARVPRSPFGGVDPFSVLDSRMRARARQEPAAPREEIPLDKAVLFDITPDKTEVFKGEAISLKMTYAYTISGISARADEPKIGAVQGFFVSEGDLMPDTRFEQDGLTYNRRTRVFKVFPMESGDFTIPAVEWPVQVSTNFNFDERVIVKTSAPIAVKVKPLPPAPPNFSGAVGEIQVASALPGKALQQGTPVDFTITVRGSGNPAAISAPVLPALEWAHLSPPTTDPDEAKRAGALKVFKYSLTPLAVGPQEVPAITITYFSPETATFVDAVAPPIPVSLSKAPDSGPMIIVDGKNAASATSTVRAELHPIESHVPDLGPARSGLPLGLAVSTLPPLAYLGLWLVVRRRRRLENDPEFARAYFARSKSAKRLADVRAAREPSDALFRAMVGFVADKLAVAEAGMTSADARRTLAERGMPAALGERVEKILRACERARYAGAPLPEPELRALLDAAVQAMDEIEQELAEGK